MSFARISRQVIRQTRLWNQHKVLTTLPIMENLQQNTEFRRNHKILARNFSVFSKSPDYSETPQMDLVTFEGLCTETLEALTDYFEEVAENDPKLQNADVAYSDGVLTVKLGGTFGTYVINRQSPNRQIWLSSPTSGPKRYDFIDNQWIYKHDGVSLHQLLQQELEKIISKDIDFLKIAEKIGK